MNTTPVVYAVSELPPPSLLNHSGSIGWVSISPDARFLVVKYAEDIVTGASENDDCIRVFDINTDPASSGYLQVTGPHQFLGDPGFQPTPWIGCGEDVLGSRLDPLLGWIYPLKHADMMMDGSTPIIVGVNGCDGLNDESNRLGRILRVDLTTGAVSRLSKKSANPCNPENTPEHKIQYYCDEASAMHVSCRNSGRSGWAYVTYDSSDGRRFSDEIVAVKIDSSGAVERFAHTHSWPTAPGADGKSVHVFHAEPHAVPSREGGRVVWASNWARLCSGVDCVPNPEIKAYVIDATCGGGCPTVQTWTASGWQAENSILRRSLSNTLALDSYRLKSTPQVVNGRYRVEIRENEQERTTLDQVRLACVDHARDVKAYAYGERVVLGSRTPPFRVTTHAGTDITRLVSGVGNSYFVGEPGETLLVALVDPSAAVAPASATQGSGGLDPVEIDPGGGKDGSGLVAAMGAVGAGASPSARDDAILNSTGILIQGQDASGTWTTVREKHPRQDFDEFLVDTLDHGPLRVVFVGQHKLRFVGRVAPTGDAVIPQPLALTSAVHSRLGDVRAAVLDADANTTSVTPGDAIALEFASVPVPQGQVRDYFLLAKGAYQSWQALAEPGPITTTPQRFALLQNRPNPFTAGTSIQFELPVSAMVRLELFDAQGRRVALLASRYYLAGQHAVAWDHRAASGEPVRPGVYPTGSRRGRSAIRSSWWCCRRDPRCGRSGWAGAGPPAHPAFFLPASSAQLA